MSRTVPTAAFHDERIDMAYWLPKLRAVDVPIPDSHALSVEKADDGPEWDTDEACHIVESLGGEAFVRSGYKSAQMHLTEGSHIHNATEKAVNSTVRELLSQHAMMQMPIGECLWLREWLDLDWNRYAREQLNPEIRAFIRDGEVVCHHPRLEGFGDYPEAREKAESYIESAWPTEYEFERHHTPIESYAERVASEFDGWWSVDFVLDVHGDWWCTDMALDALYERDGQMQGISSHPGGCEHDIEVLHSDE